MLILNNLITTVIVLWIVEQLTDLWYLCTYFHLVLHWWKSELSHFLKITKLHLNLNLSWTLTCWIRTWIFYWVPTLMQNFLNRHVFKKKKNNSKVLWLSSAMWTQPTGLLTQITFHRLVYPTNSLQKMKSQLRVTSSVFRSEILTVVTDFCSSDSLGISVCVLPTNVSWEWERRNTVWMRTADNHLLTHVAGDSDSSSFLILTEVSHPHPTQKKDVSGPYSNKICSSAHASL